MTEVKEVTSTRHFVTLVTSVTLRQATPNSLPGEMCCQDLTQFRLFFLSALHPPRLFIRAIPPFVVPAKAGTQRLRDFGSGLRMPKRHWALPSQGRRLKIALMNILG